MSMEIDLIIRDLTISSKVRKAVNFATKYHEGQTRKYTGEPYIHHPLGVAHRILVEGGDVEMVCAAVLHDVVEDTSATLADVEDKFGREVARFVDDLTDVSQPDDGNRAVRKELDRIHTSCAHPCAKAIKVADLLDNTASIVEYDKEFAKVYLHEKALLLYVLKDASIPCLWDEAFYLVARYLKMETSKWK